MHINRVTVACCGAQTLIPAAILVEVVAMETGNEGGVQHTPNKVNEALLVSCSQI